MRDELREGFEDVQELHPTPPRREAWLHRDYAAGNVAVSQSEVCVLEIIGGQSPDVLLDPHGGFSVASRPMPLLQVRCKKCKKSIPTDLNVDLETFKNLTYTERTLECPYCEEMQVWNLDDVDRSVFKKN